MTQSLLSSKDCYRNVTSLDFCTTIQNNESMALTRGDKELVAKHLVDTVLNAIQKGELQTEDMPRIADIFLKRIDTITTREEVAALLKEMATTWPVLSSLSAIEEGKMKEEQEVVVAETVETLVKNGQLNEALDAAKAATQA